MPGAGFGVSPWDRHVNLIGDVSRSALEDPERFADRVDRAQRSQKSLQRLLFNAEDLDVLVFDGAAHQVVTH